MNREVLFADIAVIGFDAKPILFRIILVILMINLVVGLLVFLYAILKSFVGKAGHSEGQTHLYPTGYFPTEKNEVFKVLGIAINKPLTKWNELLLKDFLSGFPTEDLPDFGRWIQYTGETTQKICFIKLIGYFGQTSSAETCIELLDSSDPEFCAEAVKTLGKLRYSAAEENLLEIYFDRDMECKYEILKAISIISSGGALGFLKSVYLNSFDKSERKSALEAIYMYNAEGKYFFLTEKGKSSRFEKQIFIHIENPELESRFVEEIQEFKKVSFRNLKFNKQQQNNYAMDTS